MDKIKFGFANEKNPNGSWQGIGIKDGLMLLDADLYGEVSYVNEDYIVAKVVEDEYDRFPELLDKFIVRPATMHYYKDGSGILFLNQEETEQSKELEAFLNSPGVKEKITSIEDIKELDSSIKDASFSTKDLIYNDEILATSIIPEAFENEVENNKGKGFRR